VAGLVRHRDFAELGKRRVDPFGLAEQQTRCRLVPGDFGAVGVDRVLLAERRPQREVRALDPRDRAARIGAETVGRDIAIGGDRKCGLLPLAQRYAERFLEPDGGGEGERAPAAERLLQRGDAELGLLGEVLPRDAAPCELFADGCGNPPALLGG
jgi:hypothetical protein